MAVIKWLPFFYLFLFSTHKYLKIKTPSIATEGLSVSEGKMEI